jgi:hypothetical protein
MFSPTGTRPDPRSTNGILGLSGIEGAGAIATVAKKRLAEAQGTLMTAVTTRPALALGAALAAGVIIGWLIKRR